jgi:hypothetical protein
VKGNLDLGILRFCSGICVGWWRRGAISVSLRVVEGMFVVLEEFARVGFCEATLWRKANNSKEA